MAAIGCPLPVDSKWVWGGDRRQQQTGSGRQAGGPQWAFYKSWDTREKTATKEPASATTSPAGLKLGAWVVNPTD